MGVPKGQSRAKNKGAGTPGDDAPSEDADGLGVCPGGSHDLVNVATGEVVGRTRCKSKRCPVCGPRLKDSHIAHYVEAFTALGYLIAFEAGLDPASVVGANPAVSHRQYADLLIKTYGAFASNTKRWMREREAGFSWVRAIEHHGDGLPHVHGLISCSLQDAPEVLRRRWFQQGGGIVMDVRPLGESEEELACALGYAFKQQFSERRQGYTIRASHDVAYNSAAAKERRKVFVTPDPEGVVLSPRVEPRRKRDRPARTRSKNEPVGTARIDGGRRSTRYVHGVGDGPYGVRVTAAKGSAMSYAVVRVERDAERGERTYADLATGLGSFAEAEALALQFDAKRAAKGASTEGQTDAGA